MTFNQSVCMILWLCFSVFTDKVRKCFSGELCDPLAHIESVHFCVILRHLDKLHVDTCKWSVGNSI